MALLLGLGIASQSASAECYLSPYWTYPRLNMNLGSKTIPRDIPVGTELGSYDAPTPTASTALAIGSCAGSESMTGRMLQGTPVAGFANVYSTNVPGVGYRIYSNWATSGSGPVGYFPNTIHISQGTYNITWAPSEKVTVAFVKTGPITAGTLAVGEYGNVSWSTASTPIININVTGGAFVVATCNPSKVITVPLNGISAKTLATNSSAGQTKFSMNMNCDAGVKVTATMSGTAPAGNSTAGLLTNEVAAADGGAQGVAVQMLTAGKVPVSLNTAVNYGAVGSSAWDGNDISFYAQLLKIGTIMPGTVKATATLTMTYQ
ncbi:fimbrial protein [Collimonas silvisoli]|uniref:fimbrial protein n=1 Tax=Collimonas silvisoli TaxID=2825884 RepID=UPI001B8D2088|nr:fimbrial protein [Collimonas silvisoli]